jgi:thioredoxin-like negative regulator of GroEL
MQYSGRAHSSGSEQKGDDEVTQVAQAVSDVQARPRLVFFYSKLSGRCRRVEGFIAQVLQRRRNHGTFVVHRVDAEERPDLVERFRVDRLPALVVVADRRVEARLEQPRGCRDIEALLAPWLK